MVSQTSRVSLIAVMGKHSSTEESGVEDRLETQSQDSFMVHDGSMQSRMDCMGIDAHIEIYGLASLFRLFPLNAKAISMKLI